MHLADDLCAAIAAGDVEAATIAHDAVGRLLRGRATPVVTIAAEMAAGDAADADAPARDGASRGQA